MKVQKRILALFLSVSLILSLIPPMPAAAAPKAPDRLSDIEPVVNAFVVPIDEKTGELTITVDDIFGTYTETFVINNNSAGTYLVDEYEVYVDIRNNTQVRTCYIISYNGNPFFSITDVKVDKGTNTVNVELSANKPAYLDISILEDVVGITDDWESGINLANGGIYIDEVVDNDFVAVSVSSVLPEYFIVVARLTNPRVGDLCDTFTFIEYTKAHEQFMALTVNDFDAETVVNLDDSEDNNFMSTADGVTIINAGENGQNILDLSFVEGKTYVFHNADDKVLYLNTGDRIVVISDEVQDIFLINVVNITVDGSKVTIVASDDNELIDFFDFIKIDKSEYVDVLTLDMTEADEGVEFFEDPNDLPDILGDDEIQTVDVTALGVSPKATLVNINAAATLGLSFTFIKEFTYAKLEGTLTGKLKGTVVLRYDWYLFKKDYYYAKLSIGVETGFSVKISAKLERSQFKKESINLGQLSFPIGCGFTVGAKFEIPINWEIGGSISFSANAWAEGGFISESGKSLQTIKERGASAEFGASANFRIEIGPQITPEISFLAGVVSGGMGIYAGIELIASAEYYKVIPITVDINHDCDAWADVSVNLVANVTLNFKLFWGWVANISTTVVDVKVSLYKVHISLLNHIDSTFGGKVTLVKNVSSSDCPNKSYKTTFVPRNEQGGIITNALITVKRITSGTTYTKTGQFYEHLYPGSYDVSASAAGYTFNNTRITVTNAAQTITLQGALAVVSVNGVTLNKNATTITAGATETLTATVSPSNATNKTVTWSSSNTAVATVNSNGLVTPVSSGTATITVTTADGSYKATCVVTVIVPVTGITLNKTSTTIVVGNSETLTATVLPANATNKSVTWSSGNTGVATVNSSGVVTAVSAGTAIITVETADGSRKATCTINVVIPATGVTLNKTSTTIVLGSTETLSATVYPTNATNKSVTWSSNNTGVATVNSNGVVTAISAGAATITATAADGGYKTTCVVTVVVLPAGVSLNKNATTIASGNTETLTATVIPTNATNKSVTWSSSNTAVANVNSNGVVTAVSAGTATITAETAEGGYKVGCIVTVVVLPTGVSLNKNTTTIATGNTENLTATVLPANATNKSVTWSSGNTGVATVNSNGVITAVSAGTATITVETADGGYKATCVVTVVIIPSGVTLNRDNITLSEGTNAALTATVLPANATNKSVTWSSSNTAVANVNSNGVVTALSVGAATITAETVDGGYKAFCAVTVVDYDPVADFYQQVADYASAISDMTITVQMDMTLPGAVSIPANANGKTLSIRSSDTENPVVLTRGFTGNLFTVNSGAKLILENIIVDGNKDAYPNSWGSLVSVEDGEFTMKADAVLRNNAAESGGGVTVNNFGIFTMLGGEISGNSAEWLGGGVAVNHNSTFTMLGGEINGNTADDSGGVYVDGLYMGGIYDKPTFILGGTAVIDGNTKNDGALNNVYLSNGIYITLSTDTPPALGMNVGVNFEWEWDGVIVASGARPEDVEYFHADKFCKTVIFEDNYLVIATSPQCAIISAPTLASLQDAINEYGNMQDDNMNVMVVNVTESFFISEGLYVTANANGATLIIRSENSQNPVTLTRGVDDFEGGDWWYGDYPLFTVSGGAKLTLENIILDGNKDACPEEYWCGDSPLIFVSGGEFVMEDGAVLRNNRGSGVVVSDEYLDLGPVDGTFVMNGGIITGNKGGYGEGGEGGGVAVFWGGEFTMNGGEISDNTSSWDGGGVHIADGTFAMAGGKISGNEAYGGNGGGVAVRWGEFNLVGGEIVGNISNWDGGGVYVADFGTFTMTGGKIIGNEASDGDGGGVAVRWGGEFSLIDGEIANNTSYWGGGGVYVEDGIFTMLGGKIIGNDAFDGIESGGGGNGGGGVYVGGESTFAMYGGEIKNNTSYWRGGGGVAVQWGGEFSLIDGEITDNTSYWGGGGVYVEEGTFAMIGGEISNNYADYEGGGVLSNGVFTMTGGEISGNTAYYNVGGVFGGGEITLGGNSIISGNINNNVYLEEGQYITLSTTTPPAPGMNIGVRKASGYGVIVPSGASPEIAEYFYPEQLGLMVIYEDDQLIIVDTIEERADFYRQIAGFASADNDVVIEIGQSMTLIGEVSIPANINDKTLTIRSTSAENPVTLSRAIYGSLFIVNSGAKLILENIIVDGNKYAFTDDKTALAYVDGGEFTMKDGAVLRNNNGCGVYITDYGTFIMSGGEITGNNGDHFGSGSAGIFELQGGGVYDFNGTFTMTGGKISDNNAFGGFGGGVYVGNGEFNFGGEAVISGNYAMAGGGVYVAGGAFTMSGGEIIGNAADDSGGGVYVDIGTFTMTGGEIGGNTASDNFLFYDGRGGGVYIGFSSIFALGGNAVIINNTGSANANTNVYLDYYTYITLGTGGNAPAPGMNIGVTTATPSGVIVDAGVNAGDAAYFFADEAGKTVVYDSSQLVIR